LAYESDSRMNATKQWWEFNLLQWMTK